MVEQRLSPDEARETYKRLKLLREEMHEQFEEQGMSNGPISYETLINNDYSAYLEEQYGVSGIDSVGDSDG